MKYFIILLIICPWVLKAQDFPQKPANYITDETNSVSEDDEVKLNAKLRAYEDSTSNQIFVYVAYSLNGKNLEQYSQDIFHNWHIGQGDKNNGVLIAVFVDDHKFRIQTGYGLEGALPDLLTKHIQDNDMRPLFKLNRYFEGIDKGIDQLIYYSKHEFNAEDVEKDTPWGLFVFFYVFAGLFLLITLLLTKGLKDRPTAKKVITIMSIILFLIPFVGAFLLIIMLFVALSMRKDLLKPATSGSGDSWSGSNDSSSSWSSSDSSSDSSSSFDGGGGGDSGGGGSSSDW